VVTSTTATGQFAAPIPAAPTGGPPRFLPHARLDDLIAALATDDRLVVGPRLVDGAIAMAPIESAADLPAGMVMTTAPGRVRVSRRPADDPRAARVFDHPAALGGIKPWTFPSKVDALGFETTADGTITVTVEAPPARPLAILGARACDLAALAIHDRVLAGGPAVDPDYASRRSDVLVVAVECALASATCFCTSMGTGPEVTRGADIVMSELDDGFVVDPRTAAGERIVTALALAVAPAETASAAHAQLSAVRASMPAGPAVDGLRERLLANLDHPRWDAIAERCVACANCTLVCPTCFCTGLSIESDLDGRTSTASRTWDSCFTDGFAQVAGGSFRPRHRDRYRQWLTHKFATWWDQFGSAGCVGCGRCIEWCPVGIDIRAELAAIAGPAPVISPAAIPAVPAPHPVGHVASTDELIEGIEGHVAPLVPPGYVVARVVAVRQETVDTTTLRLQTDDPAILAAKPGQFVMVGVPAFAIPPISISRFHEDGIELTIRAAGAATTFLTRLGRGATVGLRGPLGRPWPIEDAYGRDVVIVGGGIGLAPLRGLIDAILAERERFGDVRLYVGARTPRDRLFPEEVDALAGRDDVLVRVTVDRAGPDWFGRVGIVTQLFRTVTGTGRDVTAFVCGPERMMQATAERLLDLEVPPERLWLTLERHMECGVGLCGHCQLGGRFVCKDGPVFSVAELGEDLRREGL
jgi:NAD(P)H-flavin reductase/NAD-dependent dihydropyrimidine dehydrogenase PreA subunit